MNSTRKTFALGLAFFCGSFSLSAQTSKLYLSGGSQLYTLQNGVSTNIGAIPSGQAFAPAVAGDLRVAGNNGNTLSRRFTLSGTYLQSDPGVTGAVCIYDGTTDGANYNYAADLCTNQIVRTNRDWSSPTNIFTANGNIGISYSANTNSLWLSGWGGGVVSNYSLSGTLLSSFSTPFQLLTGLAYDAADNSLWFFDRSTLGSAAAMYYQYSVSGVQLQSQAHAELANENMHGGEFEQLGATSAPEPATFVLLGTGMLAIGVVARRRRHP